MSQLPRIGQQAPAFLLPRDGGSTTSLDDFNGRNLIIFFYPRDNTPGCTKEAIAFSELKEEFLSAGTDILGISADTVKKHENFIAKHDLKVPLAADTELATLKAYGVWVEKSMYGRKYMGISRTTFLIDQKGKIAEIWEKVRVDGHAEAVLAACRTLL